MAYFPKSTSIRRLSLLALFVLCYVTQAASAAGGPTNHPNVLMIVVDDLKPLLGCYGVSEIKTPNIDRLAKQGVLFENAYCQQALCAPSRSSMLTGLRPDTEGVYDLTTHFRTAVPDVITLPQAFMNAGYTTAALSKIYHDGLEDAPSWTIPQWRPAGISRLQENAPEMSQAVEAAKLVEGPDHKLINKSNRGMVWAALDLPDDAFIDGQTAAEVGRRLDTFKAAQKPFFLAVGIIRPHLPFLAPKKYFDLYPEDKIKLPDYRQPPVGMPHYAGTNGGEMRAYLGVPPGNVDMPDPLARQLIRGYYASTSFADANIGRVLDALDAKGLRDNTIVVLVGDHGWHLDDHGFWCKHTNFEQATHAPMIISAPGLAGTGQHSPALVEFVDIYPTLCELAGVASPKGLEGRSLVPVLQQPNRPWSKAAFSQYPRPNLMGYTVRTARYRYTEWVQIKDKNQVDATELYDYQADPEEKANLAIRPESAAVLSDMRATLHAGWRDAGPPSK